MAVDIGAEVRRLTLADTDVANLVGLRMHSDALPQTTTMPAIVYSVEDTKPTEHLGGIADVSAAEVDIYCYGKTRSKANELAEKVRLALELQYRGDNLGTFINTITLDAGERYEYDPPAVGSDQRRYITILEFRVFYRVATS